MTDPIGALERLALARGSGDLGRGSADLDLLTAAGLKLHRLGPLAQVLPSLTEVATTSQMAAALPAVESLVYSLGVRRTWRLNGSSVHAVALEAILLYAKPRCPHCNGTGRRPGGTVCPHCRGAGQRAPRRERAAQVLDTLEAMRALASLAESALRRSR